MSTWTQGARELVHDSSSISGAAVTRWPGAGARLTRVVLAGAAFAAAAGAVIRGRRQGNPVPPPSRPQGPAHRCRPGACAAPKPQW